MDNRQEKGSNLLSEPWHNLEAVKFLKLQKFTKDYDELKFGIDIK